MQICDSHDVTDYTDLMMFETGVESIAVHALVSFFGHRMIKKDRTCGVRSFFIQCSQSELCKLTNNGKEID